MTFDLLEGPLDVRARRLVEALGGEWRSNGAMVRCPAHQDRTPSLSVRIGQSNLLFKCFAGCDTADVLQALRRLGLTGAAAPAPGGGAKQSAGDDQGARHARRLWDDAAPVEGTSGERYLRSRLLRATPALRFHLRTPLGRGHAVVFRPALLAAVTEMRRVVAVQRLFLERDGRALAEDLKRPRLTLGRPLNGAVALEAPGATLGLAEGVETALSASVLLGFPVWATLGNERLARVAIPAQVKRLLLLPDNDAAGRMAARLAEERYGKLVEAVETLWPWRGLNDWNDVLRKGGRGDG